MEEENENFINTWFSIHDWSFQVIEWKMREANSTIVEDDDR